jgi:hypothetical protein
VGVSRLGLGLGFWKLPDWILALLAKKGEFFLGLGWSYTSPMKAASGMELLGFRVRIRVCLEFLGFRVQV